MVSNSEEDNWSNLQKQLKNNRRKPAAPTNNNNKTQTPTTTERRTYENTYLNRKTLASDRAGRQQPAANKGGANTATTKKKKVYFNPVDEYLVEDSDEEASPPAPMILNDYSPLGTPQSYRNHTAALRMDPYGINPLPNIRSPYYSARDTAYRPDLESWGVSNAAYNSYLYEEPYYMTRNSPFLPVYNSIAKAQKPYLVVPNLNTRPAPPMYKPPSPITSITNDYDPNSRFNYINVIPYNRPNIPKSKLSEESESHNLRTEQYIKSAQKLLNNKPSDYNGEELFSTKFLEDLEYKPEQMKPKPVATNGAGKKKPRQPVKFEEPIAEADEQPVPTSRTNTNKNRVAPAPRRPVVHSPEPDLNAYAIDVAESLYQREVEMMVRQMAESVMREELTQRNAYQKPIFDSIFESTVNKMVRDVAEETVRDHQKKIQILQTHEIKKAAREKIVNDLMLDHMLDTVAQHGKPVAENDDVAKLLDTMSLEILLNCHSEVRKFKDKTLKNYPIKKFHLNSFMNVALDVLVAELSTSLEEDMRDLDIIEKV